MTRILKTGFFLALLTGACSLGWCKTTDEVVVRKADLAKISVDVERLLDQRGLVIHDTNTTRYIESIITKISTGDSSAAGLHICLVKACLTNAVSYANGLLVLCSGVFTVVDNESQLAFLLAHEMAHCNLNHHVQERYELHRKSLALLRQQIVGSIFIGALASYGAEVSLQRAMCGFSRTYENEADRSALMRIMKAGYDPRNAILLFENLRTRGGGDSTKTDTLLFTHPRLSERFARSKSYLDSLRTPALSQVIADQRYRDMVSRIFFLNAHECLTTSDFDCALRSINMCLSQSPFSGSAAVIKGDIFLARRDASDLDSAGILFHQAIKQGSSPAAAYRDLGYCYLLNGQNDSAEAYLGHYLRLTPLAFDSAFVKFYIRYIHEK